MFVCLEGEDAQRLNRLLGGVHLHLMRVIGADERFGALIVGGAVRDALMQRPIGDIDLVTAAPPPLVLQRLTQAGIASFPSGLEHGVVSAVHAGHVFQIASSRFDVEPLGRQARVAFSASYDQDWKRRDFTCNALYLSADGQLFDPAKGRADIGAKRLRFIGDGKKRIEEDVLRLLRFYRFLCVLDFTASEKDHALCAGMASLLGRLSSQRRREEFFKLLCAPKPGAILKRMHENGLLGNLFPAVAHIRGIDSGKNAALHRLFLLYGNSASIEKIAAHFSLTRKEQKRWTSWLRALHLIGLPASEVRARTLVGMDPVILEEALALCRAQKTLCIPDAQLQQWLDAPRPLMPPFSGRDIPGDGLPCANAIGQILAATKWWWVQLGCRPDRTACLEKIHSLSAEARREL